jgi:hypothetical protein
VEIRDNRAEEIKGSRQAQLITHNKVTGHMVTDLSSLSEWIVRAGRPEIRGLSNRVINYSLSEWIVLADKIRTRTSRKDPSDRIIRAGRISHKEINHSNQQVAINHRANKASNSPGKTEAQGQTGQTVTGAGEQIEKSSKGTALL